MTDNQINWGLEDAKQGMNSIEKDAKKSAREKVKDKRKKRGRARERAGKKKEAPKQTSTREILIILPRHDPSSTGRASMEPMNLKKRSKLRAKRLEKFPIMSLRLRTRTGLRI